MTCTPSAAVTPDIDPSGHADPASPVLMTVAPESLSFSDREAAARRALVNNAHWSDRAIAAATGLAAKTVGAIRARETGGSAQPDARVGRDGRLRPLSTAEGRRRAAQLISDNPAASLRKIAKIAGISPATARDVRERMRRGDDPIPAKQRADGPGSQPLRSRVNVRNTGSPRRTPPDDRTSMLRSLRRDPSLRFTESGRALLLWLDARAAGADGGEEFLATIPAHCAYVVAEIARGCADEWLTFAERLKERTAQTARPARRAGR